MSDLLNTRLQPCLPRAVKLPTPFSFIVKPLFAVLPCSQSGVREPETRLFSFLLMVLTHL